MTKRCSPKPKPRPPSVVVFTTLPPELDDRLEAVRTARNPPPSKSALVRLLVERGLPSVEARA